MSLRRKKERFAELENLIRKEAEQLEERESILPLHYQQPILIRSINELAMRKRREEAEYAARLSKECEAMETEIAMLKNKRSPTEVSPIWTFRVLVEVELRLSFLSSVLLSIKHSQLSILKFPRFQNMVNER